MLGEQHCAWGRAYRGEKLLCERVQVTIGHDDRVGLARHERRYIFARFRERVDVSLRVELVELARRRGLAAGRVADTLEPLEIVIDDPSGERQRVIGRLQPPQLRRGELRDIEFGVRELTR